MNENDFMGDFEILRHQYILDKKHFEDSSEEFARKCFKVARSCGVINKYAKLLEYSFKDWNITLIYTVQDKKYGLIFDYTDGDIDNIITSLKKGLYDRIWYTKKRSLSRTTPTKEEIEHIGKNMPTWRCEFGGECVPAPEVIEKIVTEWEKIKNRYK